MGLCLFINSLFSKNYQVLFLKGSVTKYFKTRTVATSGGGENLPISPSIKSIIYHLNPWGTQTDHIVRLFSAFMPNDILSSVTSNRRAIISISKHMHFIWTNLTNHQWGKVPMYLLNMILGMARWGKKINIDIALWLCKSKWATEGYREASESVNSTGVSPNIQYLRFFWGKES